MSSLSSSDGQGTPCNDPDGTMSAYFLCQRCLAPLDVDKSFNELNEHTLAELALPISTAPDYKLEPSLNRDGEQDPEAPKLDGVAPRVDPCQGTTQSQQPGNSFLLVNESGQPASLSHKIANQAKLFDMISNNSEEVIINSLDTYCYK